VATKKLFLTAIERRADILGRAVQHMADNNAKSVSLWLAPEDAALFGEYDTYHIASCNVRSQHGKLRQDEDGAKQQVVFTLLVNRVPKAVVPDHTPRIRVPSFLERLCVRPKIAVSRFGRKSA
jgi:hypothetical protein